MSKLTDSLPHLDENCFKIPQQNLLTPKLASTHPPRILMLYGSLRERSYSKLLTLEAARLLEAMGADVKVFDPLNMITIPNQSSVAKAFLEFEEDGRMKPSAYYDRVVDVMEELMKFTLLTRDISPYLVDRYSQRKESADELSKRVNQKAIERVGAAYSGKTGLEIMQAIPLTCAFEGGSHGDSNYSNTS